jgi:hypothetical protein
MHGERLVRSLTQSNVKRLPSVSYHSEHQSHQLAELVPRNHGSVQSHAHHDHPRLALVACLHGAGYLCRKCLAQHFKFWYRSTQYRRGSEMVHGKQVRVEAIIVAVEVGVGGR